MSAENISAFVSNIMSIRASGSMGGASAGIFGTTGMGDPAVRQLKSAGMAFVSAYREGTDSEVILRLGKEVEGHLQTLQAISIITSDKCDQLTSELHDLIERSPAAG